MPIDEIVLPETISQAYNKINELIREVNSVNALQDQDIDDSTQVSFSGSGAPGVNDDSANTSSNGIFEINSLWVDTGASPTEAYRCSDATPTAAVWLNTSLEVGDLGALAIKNTVDTAEIDDNAVTFAKVQDVATSRILGRVTGGSGSTEELTSTQATTLINTFTDALKGVAPASAGGTVNFLRADGSWAVPPGGGSGDVNKVGTPVNNQLGVWTGDGTIEGDSNVTWDSGTTTFNIGGSLTISGTVDGRDIATDGGKLDGIEALADVTDTANVTSAGALMDSEVDADLKTFALPASTTISVFGATIIDDADASAVHTTLGLVIGTDVQAHDAVLDATTASFLVADESKLDGIEAGADVNDPESFIFAASDETTDLTTGTAKFTFRMPYAFTLTAVRASVNTAPTDAILIVDINEGGSTILSTKLSIDATEKTSTTAASAAVISDASLADDAEITIDIDQVGSTIAGKGLKVVLIGSQT